MSRIRAALLAALLLTVPGAALADVAKSGPELQANTSTGSRSRRTPATAADTAGRFVVVWTSGSNYSNGDGSREGVFARHYDEHGAATGNEFQVNTYTTLRQLEPTVAAQPAGGFVIAWSSGTYYDDAVTQDGSAFGVFLRRFDRDGQPLDGSDQQVNTYTRGNQAEPDVAADADGDFVVVWTSGRYGINQDGDEAGVFGQRFAASGAPDGGEFQANTYTTGEQGYPSVSRFPGGGFVVVWQSFSYPAQDGDRNGVFGQRFDAAGARTGIEFQGTPTRRARSTCPTCWRSRRARSSSPGRTATTTAAAPTATAAASRCGASPPTARLSAAKCR
jgi:large repetitive protein